MTSFKRVLWRERTSSVFPHWRLGLWWKGLVPCVHVFLFLLWLFVFFNPVPDTRQIVSFNNKKNHITLFNDYVITHAYQPQLIIHKAFILLGPAELLLIYKSSKSSRHSGDLISNIFTETRLMRALKADLYFCVRTAAYLRQTPLKTHTHRALRRYAIVLTQKYKSTLRCVFAGGLAPPVGSQL